MTTEDVKRNIWRNSISNYIFLFVRLGLGLVVFRMIWQALSDEELGFWATLWSVFGYGILLDFGFGFTAQKRVAELSVHKDWKQLSQVLSTIFFVYVGIAVILILIGVLGSPYLIHVFKITPQNQQKFTEVLVYFFCGMGLAFPLGIFPEILRGQQRISLTNYILLGGFLLSFSLMMVALKQHWGLSALFIITLGCSILADLVCGFFAFRQMPEVKIHPSLFSRGMIHDTLRFSVFAYITTVSNIILTRTDQLVISMALAVSAVKIYSGGSKVGDMFGNVTIQLPETLSPAAAHLNAKGDRDFLRQLLIDGTRFSVMVATPLYLICAFYMEPILKLVTGDHILKPQTYWVGEVLLLWQYVTVLTQSVSKRIFMMCGHERKLMLLGVGEGIVNLGLSLGLILYFRNVLCVAVGSLVATSIFGWGYLWPWSAREANLTGWSLARTVLLPTWVACLPLFGLILIERIVPQLDFRDNPVLFFVEGALAFLAAAAGIWKFGLNSGERVKLAAYFEKRLGKRSVV